MLQFPRSRRSELSPKELSITISRKRGDVSQGDVDRLENVLQRLGEGGDLLRAEVVVEPGGRLDQLHFQGVAELVCTTPAAVTKWLRTVADLPGALFHVHCKVLAQKGVHTFEGMLGYVHKMDGDPRWQLVYSKGVTDSDRAVGATEYEQHGNMDAINKKVKLTLASVHERAYMFNQRRNRDDVELLLAPVVLRMVQSKKFRLTASFLACKGGLPEARANALWFTLLWPEKATLLHVESVLYGHTGRPYRYWHDGEVPGPDGDAPTMPEHVDGSTDDEVLWGGAHAGAVGHAVEENHGIEGGAAVRDFLWDLRAARANGGAPATMDADAEYVPVG